MYASNSHSYTHLILALGIVREPTVWGFITSKYPGIHDIGLPTHREVNEGHKAAGGCKVGGGSDPDLACMGKGCTVRYEGRSAAQGACVGGGRLNSGLGGCTIPDLPTGINGALPAE